MARYFHAHANLVPLPLPLPLPLLLPMPQVLVKLRCPGHPPLSFCGSSPLAASDAAAGGDDSNSVDDDHNNLGPDSEAWRKTLSREIAKLKREAGEGSQQQQQQQAGPTTAGARGVGGWRFWNVVSGAVQGGASAAGAAGAAEPGVHGVSGSGVSFCCCPCLIFFCVVGCRAWLLSKTQQRQQRQQQQQQQRRQSVFRPLATSIAENATRTVPRTFCSALQQ